MREMKDSGVEWIGKIPKYWNLERIQFCLKEISVLNYPIKTEQVLSLVKDKGVMLYEDKGNKGNKAKEDVSTYKLAYPNTLIVNSMNILIGSVGISQFLGCVSPVYYVFKDTYKSDLRFINYVFNTREFQKELRKYANGILEIRLRVSAYDIFKRKIPLPSKEEQRKIADFLDEKCAEIDALTSDIQTQIETLEEYKKSVITEAVTKGLDPNVEMKDSGIEWVNKIPINWEINKIKYLSNQLFKGQGIKKDDVDPSGSIPCIRYGEIYSKYSNTFNQCFSFINSNQLSHKQPFLQQGDIVFAITGELIEEIGKNVLYTGNEHCAVGGDIVVARITGDTRFMNYALNSSYCQNQKSCNKFKLKVVHISSFEIGNIILLLPPTNIQKEIADFLDKKCSEIDLTISEKQQQLETLAEYKKSLIYEYVTGKREVA